MSDATRAVFLDRDGVLNEPIVRDGRPYAPLDVADFVVVPGAADAIARLHDNDFLAIVVTNQRDVSAGTLSPHVLDQMHARLVDELGVDAIEVCSCGDGCRRYKPEPGMLEDAAAAHRVDLATSFMVGDRWRDVSAGVAAGCTTVLIDRSYDEPLRDAADHVVSSLEEAVEVILGLVSAEVPA